MGWLGIIIILVCLGLAVYWTLEGKESHESWCYTLLFCFPLKIIFALLFWACITIAVSTMHSKDPKVVSKSRDVNIYSIGMNSTVHGSFVLGCGTVEGEPVYRFFCQANNGFKCDEVSAKRATIVESDDTPHITYITEYKYTGESNWLMDAYFGDNDAWRLMRDKEEYIIYLPKGSVVQTFSIEP